MGILNKLKWVVTLIAVLLNFFIYFYPDLLNEPGKCHWHQYSDSIGLTAKFSFLRYLPLKIYDLLLLNVPYLQDKSHDRTPSAFYDNGKVKDIRMLAFGDPQINGNWKLTKYIKRLDNYGNDYYLGHIYNVMKRRTDPTHVAVLGDLFSSQWILDSEYYNRTYRYVERIFTRKPEYKRTAVETYLKHEDYDWYAYMDREKALDPLKRFNSRVYEDMYDWVNKEEKYPSLEEPLFINLTGNHDIGYSGDATWQHLARFHLLMGQNNYVINYNKGTPEEWRLIVLDSLTMEGPALQEEFLNYTWSFVEGIRDIENKDFKGTTILLTHIPFYKPPGLCADEPDTRYYFNNIKTPYKNGLLRSQNHLSYETTQKILSVVFPEGSQNGLILTGHDHEGCDNYYNYKNGAWYPSKSVDLSSNQFPVREITVKSMMGGFDGQSGILTGHFNYTSNSWDFSFSYCSFIVQHWWWATKIVSLVALFLHSFIYTYTKFLS